MPKSKLRWQDMFDSPPDWAVQARADYLQKQEAALKLADKERQNLAIISAMEKDAGVSFDDETKSSMLDELRSGKPLNFAQSPEDAAPEAAAPVLPSAKKAVPEKSDSLWDSIQEGVVSLIGRADAARESGRAASATVDLVNADPTIRRGRLQERLARLEAGTATKTVPMYQGIAGEYETEEVPLSPEERAREVATTKRKLAEIGKAEAAGTYKAEMDRLRADKQRSQQAAGVATSVAEEAEGKLPSGVARVTKVVGSNLTSEQALSTVAPIAIAVLTRSPAATGAASVLANIPQAKASFASAFQTAIDKHGATVEEATAYAGAVTAIEFGSEVVGGALGGAATAGISFLKDMGGKASKEAAEALLEKTIKSRTRRFAVGQALDAAGEASSVLGQRLLDTSLEGTDYGTEAGQKALAQANEDFSYVESLTDAVIGSVGVGAAPGAIGAQLSYKADVAAQNKRTVDDMLAADTAMNTQAVSDEESIKSEIARVQNEARITQENFANIDKQREEEAAQKALEEEAGFQTIERDANLPTSRVERYADVVERVPVNPAAAITPEQVQAQQEQAAQDKIKADQLAAQQKRAADEAEASTRLEEAKTRITLEQKRKEKAAKAAETVRRNNLSLQVAKEHADKTPKEQAQILADLIATPDAKAPAAKDKPKTLEDKVQGVINQVEGLRKQKATTRVNNRIRSLYRQNPNMSAKEIADKLAQEEGPAIEEPVAPSEAELASKVKELSTKKGTLNIDQAVDAAGVREQEAGVTARRTPEQQKVYADKVRSLVNSMANTQENVDIRNLIKQGKLVITDRAESVGREPTKAGAQYDIADGKMFVYLDSIDSKKPKADILAALVSHEAGHAGQFNQRDGRSNLFQHLLGDKGNAAANKQIRELAKSGNKLAQDAVASATAAATRNKTVANVENLELVPYLFSSSKLNSPGRLGKVVRDVKVAARQTARKFGADWDFSLDELTAAADKVAGEIVKTDLKPSDQKGSADMIYGENSQGANDPENIARTYTSVDGKRKYVLSDADAKLKAGAGFTMLNDAANNEPTKLGDIYEHNVLYKEHPEAKNIVVRAVPDAQLNGSFGQYDPNDGSIDVARSVVEGTSRMPLDEALIHEIQHFVQDRNGRSAQFHDSQNAQLSATASKADTDFKDANTAREKIAREIMDNLIDITKEASLVLKNTIRNKVLGNPNMSDAVKVNRIVTMLEDEGVRISPTGQRRLDKMTAANTAFSKAVKAYNETVLPETYGNYYANITEAEAFRTQEDRKKSQAELDKRGNPEEQMRRFQGNLTGGRIDVPEGNGNIVARGSLDAAAPETKAANPQFSVKERINRILSHGRQDRLDTVKIAEDLHTQFVDALKADTGKAELSDEMNKELNDFLTSPDQGTVEGRARLIAEMKAKYPETTKVLVEARDRISDMTMDTINDMLSTGRPLSVTQRKNIATMLANKDTYMSRAYAAFQAGRGRKWAETRWNNFAKNIGKDVDQITNPKVKADVKAVSDAIKVITKSLQIPDVDSMQDMTMDQLVSLAERHGIKESQLQYDRNDPDASWLKRDELISELEKVKATYPEGMLEQIAMGDAKDLLGLGDKESNYAKQMSALARNPGTLKERQRVPLEIRRLLGEIELAPGAFMATMSNQAALRARAKVVSELINDPQGDIAITRDKYLNLPAKEQKKYTEVRSEEWGGLNGMYLRDYAYTRMEEVTGLMYSWRDAAKRMSHDVSPLTGKLVQAGTGTLGALNRWTKLMAVVYNPMSWIGNFGGSFLNMVGAGNFSPAALWEGMGTAREYVGGTFNTTTTPRLSKVIRYMNLEAADIAELQNVLGNTLEKYFDNPNAFKDSVVKLDKHGHGLLGRGHKSVIAGYAIADNWSKIANFYHRYGVLKDMYDAAGISKTEEQILQEAGDDTSYTNISPERVHSIIRTAESAGLSQYAPYFAEVLRTRATNVALAHKDMQRGSQLRKDGHTKAANILQTHAAMRLAGQMVVNALLPAVGAFKIASHLAAVGVPTALAYSLANSLSALGDDDEKNDLRRELLSEMNRVQDMMMVGKNENGYPIYFPFSQKLDPNGPFTDLIRAFVYADTPEQLYNNLKASSLYIFPQVLKDAYKAVADDKFAESDVSRLWPQLTQTLVDAGIPANDVDRYFNVADNFIPGVLRAQKTQNTADGVVADPATQKSLERLSTYGGVRFETFDPRRNLIPYSDKSKEDKATHNGVLNRSLMNTPTLTDKAVLDITEKFFREELARQKADYRSVRRLRAWEFTEEQIPVLLEQGGYPKKSIPDLMEGNATVAIKLKSLIEYADSSGAYQDSRDYEKRNDKAVTVVNKLLEMEEELNELGITIDKSQMPKGWNE